MDEILAEIIELEARELHMETNAGTYGVGEAGRKCGVGDPAFANRDVYETVGTGARRETGPGPDRYPGRMRQIGHAEMGCIRSRIKHLKEQERRLIKEGR